MTTPVRLAFVPRDGLFCKDGRGWHTSTSGRGHSLDWPWPSTVLGAVRTMWGRAEEGRRNVVFTPSDWRQRTADIKLRRSLVIRRPHRDSWNADHRVWPMPADALWLEELSNVQKLEPVPPGTPTLGRDDDDAREALWRPAPVGVSKPMLPPRWWSDADFSAWLAGHPVPKRGIEDSLAMSRRIQVHVGIRPEELTADESILFSHDVVETIERNEEWAIGIEADLPEGGLPPTATLGSDGRSMRIETLPQELFEPSASVLEAFRLKSPGLRLFAITPLCFEQGWLPDGVYRHEGAFRGRLPGIDGDVILRAAFVPRPIHVSGWDMAAGTPKPTARMAPAGAVYFFEHADGKPFDETAAQTLWLSAIGSRTEEGFGRIVPGTWHPTRNEP